MEGIKLIAQSTFDRHQKFRPSASGGGGGLENGQAPYRYNVIEIGAFGSPPASTAATTSSTTIPEVGTTAGAPATTAALKRQTVLLGGAGGVTQQNGSRTDVGLKNSAANRVSVNEWMVHEEDLVAFMKKRPVDIQAAAPGNNQTQRTPAAEDKAKPQLPGHPSGTSATTGSTGLSRRLSYPSSKITDTPGSTAATGGSSGGGGGGNHNDRSTTTTTRRDLRGTSTKEEVEAVASLKLICIQRAAPNNNNNTAAPEMDHPSSPNTLAIGRDCFLRLYVDQMEADHCVLYYLAREYDGFHEFNDPSRGIVTKFVGTSDYALIWTFNRHTLETKGLFLDRCYQWQPNNDEENNTSLHTTTTTPVVGSAPTTPSRKSMTGENSNAVPLTPSRRWTKKQTGTVTSSDAWQGFRDTLKTYRKYIYAPQLLSFVCCVHMIRAFDEEVNDSDLPALKAIEVSLAAQEAVEGTARQINHTTERGFARSQTSSFAIVPQNDPFAPFTPPGETDKHTSTTAAAVAAQQQQQLWPLDRKQLLSQTLAANRIDNGIANKLRHLKVAKNMLEIIAREHETVLVDIVAPAFLDRYHRTMQGMNEAIPALERHITSLEEYLGYLKGRTERLSGLVRSLTLLLLSLAATSSASSSSTTTSAQTQSDALSLRCNEADSRSDLLRSFPPIARTRNSNAAAGGGSSDALGIIHHSRPGPNSGSGGGGEAAKRTQLTDKQQRRDRDRSFYAGYLLRGHYSHRLA